MATLGAMTTLPDPASLSAVSKAFIERFQGTGLAQSLAEDSHQWTLAAWPRAETRIVAEPAAILRTIPAESTLATAGLSTLHDLGVDTGAPLRSTNVALKRRLSSTKRLAAAGATVST